MTGAGVDQGDLLDRRLKGQALEVAAVIRVEPGPRPQGGRPRERVEPAQIHEPEGPVLVVPGDEGHRTFLHALYAGHRVGAVAYEVAQA